MTDVPTLVSLLPFRAEPSSIGRYRKYIPPHPPGGGLTGKCDFFYQLVHGKTSITNTKKM